MTGQATAVVLHVQGRLIRERRHEFKEEAFDALSSGAKALVVDCADAGDIDSSGLGVLVTLQQRCVTCKATLTLVNLSEQNRALFVATRLDTLFAIEGT